MSAKDGVGDLPFLLDRERRDRICSIFGLNKDRVMQGSLSVTVGDESAAIVRVDLLLTRDEALQIIDPFVGILESTDA